MNSPTSLPLSPSLSPSLSHLLPAAVAQALHDRVDLRLEHLGQLGAVLVDARCLAVVQPGVVEHEPHVVHVLPGLLVLARVQLALDGRQVHGVLHDVKVVLLVRREVRGAGGGGEGGGGGGGEGGEIQELFFFCCSSCVSFVCLFGFFFGGGVHIGVGASLVVVRQEQSGRGERERRGWG